MSAKMSNAPVYYALAQAHFNPIAAMAKYINEVQDLLRKEGYPLFDEHQVTHLQINTAHGQAATEPNIIKTIFWIITKKDRTSGFILDPSSIRFHTTHYETNNEFIPELLRGLAVVHDVVKLDHLSRLGLRYLDAVLPLPGETVEQYLVEGLHGLRFGTTPTRNALNESVFETECEPLLPRGTLIARVHRMTSTLGYPPDIPFPNLVPMNRFIIDDPIPHAVIDTDHFVEGQMPLDDFPKINNQLVSMHATIKLVFNASITDHARTTWA